MSKAIRAAAESVIEAEPEVTSFDTILGDGDCGTTLKNAATGNMTFMRKVWEY